MPSGTDALPVPYTNSRFVTEYATTAQIHDIYTVRPNLLNQFSVSFSRIYIPLRQSHRGWQLSDESRPYRACPPESPAPRCPALTSRATTLPSAGVDVTAVNIEAANTFDLQNNVLWTKGKHFITVGFQYQALQDNFNNPLTGTLASFNFSNNETANFGPTGTLVEHHRFVLCELFAGFG